MVTLVGLFQVLLGTFRLGKLTIFVSFSVTTGFLAGISVLLILNQLPVITGIERHGCNSIARSLSLLGKLDEFDWWSLRSGVLTLILAVTRPEKPLKASDRLLVIS